MTPYERQSLLIAKLTLFVAVIALLIAASGLYSPMINLYSKHFASVETSKVEVKPRE